ncbi:retinol dehydrogenase 12 [Microdochium nivale]|nr:retinol dehydrogenase 12 [Microdochium nivale]
MGASGSKSKAFNPKVDIPTLKDKVILITGGTSGIGEHSVLEFAKHEPKEIWLAARNAAKAKEVIDKIKTDVPSANIRFVQADIGSFASVRAAAKQVLESADRLDILLLNAGIMGVPAATTGEGYEIQFGTNHMGHALLTKLLQPLLLKTAEQHGDARVVFVSSAAHAFGPAEGIIFDSLKTKGEAMTGTARYGQSKLANALYAWELARHNPQLTVVALHPGVVRTNIAATLQDGNWFAGAVIVLLSWVLAVDVPTGTLNQLWASTAEKKDIVSGTYYEPIGVTGCGKPQMYNQALAEKLWEWTDKELEGQTVG